MDISPCKFLYEVSHYASAKRLCRWDPTILKRPYERGFPSIEFLYILFRFGLHLIGRRRVNHQEGFLNKKQKHQILQDFLWDFFAHRVLQSKELAQLDVACSIKPKQATWTWAVSSAASEARFTHSREAGPGHHLQPQRDVQRPGAQIRSPAAP